MNYSLFSTNKVKVKICVANFVPPANGASLGSDSGAKR